MRARIVDCMTVGLLLAGCAGEQGPAPPPPLPQSGMTGRWTLSAPNAPSCDMQFEGTPGQTQGAVNPDGGCPGKFYTSRRWAFTLDTLTLAIADNDNQPLAQLKLSGAQFAGQSADGIPITLSR